MILSEETTHVFFEMNLSKVKDLGIIDYSEGKFFNLNKFFQFCLDDEILKDIIDIQTIKLVADDIDLSDKLPIEVNEIIQTNVIEEKDIQKLLSKGMLLRKRNGLFYLLLSRNIFEKELENRVRLADQATHILFKIDFNKEKHIISRGSSASEVNLNLKMFFQSYSSCKAFRDRIDIQTIKLIDDYIDLSDKLP